MTSEQMEFGADAPERVRRLEWKGALMHATWVGIEPRRPGDPLAGGGAGR
jgi:hypothetical protein